MDKLAASSHVDIFMEKNLQVHQPDHQLLKRWPVQELMRVMEEMRDLGFGAMLAEAELRGQDLGDMQRHRNQR